MFGLDIESVINTHAYWQTITNMYTFLYDIGNYNRYENVFDV